MHQFVMYCLTLMFFLLLMQEYLKFTLIWNDLNVYILWFSLCLLTFCNVYFVMFTFVEFPHGF
jgi:hypothetical protein